MSNEGGHNPSPGFNTNSNSAKPSSSGGQNNHNPSGGGGSRENIQTVLDAFSESSDIQGESESFELEVDEELDEHGFVIRRGQVLAIDMDEDALELIRDLGFSIERMNRLTGLDVSVIKLGVPDGMSTVEALQTLRHESPEAIFDFNHIYALSSADEAQSVKSRAWADSVSTYEGKIGLIDTDIDTYHPALTHANIIKEDFSKHVHTPVEHGTAIASILVGRDEGNIEGVMPQASLYSANVFYTTPSRRQNATAESLTHAINWMMEKQVPVINMSLAGPQNELLRLGVIKAQKKGHIIVAAVGNDGPAAPAAYPAAYEQVIAVTAIDYQGRIYRRANRGAHLDFSALGVSVRAALPGKKYKNYSGTSFASPIVAALTAITLEQSEDENYIKIYETLRKQAVDLGMNGFDPVYGYGVLTVERAEVVSQ